MAIKQKNWIHISLFSFLILGAGSIFSNTTDFSKSFHLLASADSLSERDNSKTPTYSSDIVSSLGNGIPSYSNNEIVKENLRNAGITQLTVDDNSHIFNNDSTQASYRVGLNPKYKYSILQVSPQNGLKNDYPFMMSHAALVSGNTVTPLNATKMLTVHTMWTYQVLQ